jgi:predicted transcriptional regulator YheO
VSRETLFKNIEAVARGLHEFFGDSIEVVVHDFADPDRSIRAILGNLTGRHIGGGASETLRRHLSRGEDMHNYPARTKDGRPLKASTMFLRDEDGLVFGALSLNYDLTETMLLSNWLERFARRSSVEASEDIVPIGENGVGGQIEQAFLEAAGAVGRPAPLMTREQKIQVVRDLERKGIFLIKGAVDEVARHLGVSRYTIYNYRKEISLV